MTFPILMRTVMNQFIPDHEHLMLDLKQVCQLTRLSKSTVYRLELKVSFPRRIRISERRVVWRAIDIYDFITERVEESLNG